MALPGDVTVFTLNFGSYMDAAGAVALVGAKGKLYPVSLVTGKRLNLVHVATGQAVLPIDLPITIGAGGTATVGPIPHTDNPGLSTIGFGYHVEWAIGSGAPSPGNKTFAVPAVKGATADFDLLAVADAVPGVFVPVADLVKSVNGQVGVVVLTGDSIADGTTGKILTSTERSKLAGIATGATANDTDANLKARANHTGTQSVSTVTGLAAVATTGAYTDLTAKPTIPTVGAAGAGAAVALSSTDASVTNARTPTTHATSHASGGSDPLTPAAIGADASGAAAAAQAFAIQRANHTGTQAATTISGLAAVATSGAKADVGLGNVDNTSDATKPVSAAQQTAIDTKAALQGGRPTDISANRIWGLLPGVISVGAVTTLATAAVSSYYIPFAVEAAAGITLDALQIEVTTVATAGATARLYIAAANSNWEPTSLVATLTPLAIDTVGQKTVTPATVLARGRYLVAINPTAAATFRAIPVTPADGTWISPAGWSANPYVIVAARGTSNPQLVPNYNAFTAGAQAGLVSPFIARWTVTPF